MCEVSQEQINCFFESGRDVQIFDKDNWVTEQQQSCKQLKTHKHISYKEKIKDNNNAEIKNSSKQKKHKKQVIQKIDKQLQNSKQNFFKVTITKKEPNLQKQKQDRQSKHPKSLPNLQSMQYNPTSILKQGYLDKRTDSFIFRWKTRYFALTSEKLYFFQDQSKTKVVGCVNFQLVDTQLKQNQKEGLFTLDFGLQTQQILLYCPDQKQWVQWVNAIKRVLDYQSKQRKLLLRTFVKPMYSFQDSITEKEFIKNAQTGDILLFYTRNTGARIQRFLTNSDFDHVAMVVKFTKNQLMVFQSNQTYGVSVFEWHQYIRYFDLYEKVTLRKLHSVRKEQMHHSFLNFAKKNLGKKYDINTYKLLKLQSDFNWEQTKQEQDQSRGYFCSELIAKAYKTVGLFDKKKYSGRYWPVDFSEKAGIQLKNGAYLGSQQSIILTKHIKNKL